MQQRLSWSLVVLIAAAVPAAAQHAGHASSLAGLRAGPGEEYRRVGEASAGNALTVYGCLKNGRWCDVRTPDARGWMPAQAIALERGDLSRVVPKLEFSLDAYWDAHYRGREWTVESERALWRDHSPGNSPALEVLAPGEGLPQTGDPSIARRAKQETRVNTERTNRERAEIDAARSLQFKRDQARTACRSRQRAQEQSAARDANGQPASSGTSMEDCDRLRDE
ncbi:SH3 domain-containing protein [Xanthomonas nasturtii]|uniref:SH3 domain-containing protein n=1 Tax=Xanthomonas TaxID=338 RepID=UPI002882DDED|nr:MULTISPECIES: SH3 domain-containing protein [Xanthomonas]MEA9556950.1 SH3 domain-containing protein [Xanthomonas nasturtii]MEA9577764.1 SH3 domain-containing protein [Xanthomonas nasturtii]